MKIIERFKEIKPTQLIFPLVLFVIFIGSVIGIVNYQNKAKQKALPMLEIISPADGAVFSDAQIVVTGKTNSKNTVKINDKEAKIGEDDIFYEELPLSVGENTIIVIAENKAGTQNKKELIVTRKDGETATNNPTAQDSGVTAQPAGVNISSETANVSGDGKGNLTTSGPETFWLLESASLSAAGAAWYATRKKLKQEIKK